MGEFDGVDGGGDEPHCERLPWQFISAEMLQKQQISSETPERIA